MSYSWQRGEEAKAVMWSERAKQRCLTALQPEICSLNFAYLGTSEKKSAQKHIAKEKKKPFVMSHTDKICSFVICVERTEAIFETTKCAL